MTKTKTQHQITRTVRRLLLESTLADEMTGKVYYDGSRPRDSKAEDAVIILTDGDAEEVQEGTVTINVFFPDTDPWSDGVFVEDGERAETLETLAQEWADSLTCDKTDGYLFRLASAIHTTPEPDTREHFVVIRLSFKQYNEE